MKAGTWSELHDATLESLEVRWSSGEVLVRLRTGDATRPRQLIVASGVCRLSCDRQMPWGFSVSINEVRGPAASANDTSILEIEMQSGDLVRIEAATFSLQHEP
ncbi:MAG TPA: hypothetical protein VEB43_11055 [Anaeromyxobacter sp.]|nr:hypothetical protein [Anaeromyxobacter sp.]